MQNVQLVNMGIVFKYFIIGAGTLLLLSALYFVFMSNGENGVFTQEGKPAPQIDPGISFEYPTGDSFVIGTEKGGVTVKNFYKTAKEIIEQTEVVLAETKDYLIVYHAATSNFDIEFLSKASNFESILVSAESDFLSRLGVFGADACKLGVTVNVPYGRDLIVGGQRPLSFCSGF